MPIIENKKNGRIEFLFSEISSYKNTQKVLNFFETEIKPDKIVYNNSWDFFNTEYIKNGVFITIDNIYEIIRLTVKDSLSEIELKTIREWVKMAYNNLQG